MDSIPPKVSFIIPVYNVEAYLEQCVSSLLNQTYKNYEIILVDDGSPDKCPLLCDKIARANDCVLVIHKNNGGLSSARNKGLEVATGEFIIFVDSDDYWLKEDALYRLIQEMDKEKLDFVSFNYRLYYQNDEKYICAPSFPKTVQEILSGDEAFVELVKSGSVPISACSKIIRQNFLVDNHILFQEGVIAEDFAWFIDLIENSTKCKFINEYIYAYRQNVRGSITNTPGDKNFFHGFNYLQEQLERLDLRHFSKEAKSALKSFYAYTVCILVALSPYSSTPRENTMALRNYYWLLDYDMNPKVHRARMIKKLFGKSAMEILLRWYIHHRRCKYVCLLWRPIKR